MNDKKERRTHSEEFKQQIVQLYNIGKSKAEICREYDLAHSLLDRWIKRINSSGSTENEIIEHRKKSNCSNCEKRTNS
jgi:transposase